MLIWHIALGLQVIYVIKTSAYVISDNGISTAVFGFNRLFEV